MEEFCRSALKKLGDNVVTDFQWLNTNVRTYFTPHPHATAAGHEFIVTINVVNESNISFQFLKQDSNQRHIVTSACLPNKPKPPANVVFGCCTLSSSNWVEKVRRSVMRIVLDNMLMTPSLRRQIMDLALDTTRASIASRPPRLNCIWIDIHVCATFKFDLDEMPVLDDKDELWKEVKGYAVPAIDAETCTICLKDFLGEDDGSNKYVFTSYGHKFLGEDDGSNKYHVFTPCGHKFHVDCINGWLRVSKERSPPSCPICRHNF